MNEKNIEVIYEKTNEKLKNTTLKRAIKMIKKKKAIWLVENEKILLNQKSSDVRKIKREFLKNAEKICYLCGGEILQEQEATVDHIIAKANYGPDKKINYAISHKKCNSLKGKMTIKELVEGNYFDISKKEEKKLIERERKVKAALNIK